MEIRHLAVAPISGPHQPKGATKKNSTKQRVVDLDAVLKRSRKLRPTNRIAAEKSIRTMFQFNTSVEGEEKERIIESLCKQGSLTIDDKGKIQFPDV